MAEHEQVTHRAQVGGPGGGKKQRNKLLLIGGLAGGALLLMHKGGSGGGGSQQGLPDGTASLGTVPIVATGADTQQGDQQPWVGGDFNQAPQGASLSEVAKAEADAAAAQKKKDSAEQKKLRQELKKEQKEEKKDPKEPKKKPPTKKHHHPKPPHGGHKGGSGGESGHYPKGAAVQIHGHQFPGATGQAQTGQTATHSIHTVHYGGGVHKIAVPLPGTGGKPQILAGTPQAQRQAMAHNAGR